MNMDNDNAKTGHEKRKTGKKIGNGGLVKNKDNFRFDYIIYLFIADGTRSIYFGKYRVNLID